MMYKALVITCHASDECEEGRITFELHFLIADFLFSFGVCSMF